MHSKAVSVVALLVLGALVAVAACEIAAEAICQANGPGVHCHPCRQDAYIVCGSSTAGTLETCEDGNVWDAFTARCTAAASNPSACVPGANVRMPPEFSNQGLSTPNPTVDAPRSELQQPLQPAAKQTWGDWAASSFASVLNSAKGQLMSLANTLLPAKQLPQQPYKPSMRTVMFLGAVLPSPSQLLQMQAGLARAADMQQRAMLLAQDANIAEAVAAKELQTVQALMTDASASSSNEAAAAEAQQRLQQAEAAQEAATEMEAAAQQLLEAAAAEAAGVALAISTSTSQLEQQHLDSSSSSSSQNRFYGPSILGAIMGTISASPAAGFPGASRDNEYYYQDGYGYDDMPGLGYTYGEIGGYYYDDEDDVAAPAALALTRHNEAALFGDLEEIHDEVAWVKDELRDWVDQEAFGANTRPLPPPLWAHGDEFVDIYTDGEDQQMYYFDDADYYDADEIAHSTSIILASSLQDRMVRLASQALADTQQAANRAGDNSTASASANDSSSSTSSTYELALGPMPLRMTIKREDEMLRLAHFFDSLESKLNDTATAQLNEMSVDAQLHVQLVGGLPVLQLEQDLLDLMPTAEGERLKSMLNAQMAELFADFVTLSYPDDYEESSSSTYALQPPGSDDYDYALLYTYESPAAGRDSNSAVQPAPLPPGLDPFADPDAGADMLEASQNRASIVLSSSSSPAEEFEDAELIKELDAALLQLEQEEQQSQQEGQARQSLKAAGLVLPGAAQPSTQQVV